MVIASSQFLVDVRLFMLYVIEKRKEKKKKLLMWIWAYRPYHIQESPWDQVRSIASYCLNVASVQRSLSIWIYYSGSGGKLFTICRLVVNWKKSQFLRFWTSTLGNPQMEREREREAFVGCLTSTIPLIGDYHPSTNLKGT